MVGCVGGWVRGVGGWVGGWNFEEGVSEWMCAGGCMSGLTKRTYSSFNNDNDNNNNDNIFYK